MNTTLARRGLLRGASAAALLSFAVAAPGQSPLPQVVVPFPLPDLRVPIPPSLGSGAAALRLVDCDLDGDMLRDECILWSNGEVTLAYAPEVLSSFAAFPSTGARDIARVPGDHSPPVHTERDGILVLDSAGLGYVTLVASTATASGLQRTNVTATAAWHELVRVEVAPLGTDCWLLGLAADKRTVRVGSLTGTTVNDLGTVVASDDVQQMLLVAHPGLAEPRIVARTIAGVQMWSASGQPQASLTSPTSSAFGAITAFSGPNDTHIAWLALSGQHWRLRTLVGPAMATDFELSFASAVEQLPGRFRPTGLDVLPNAFGGFDGLVLYQNTRPWHVVLEPDAANGFAPLCGIEVPGLTMNVDNCPSVLVDLDRDPFGDVATVLTSMHCLQFARRVPLLANNIEQLGLLPSPDEYDYLAGDCQAVASNAALDQLDLRFLVPLEFRGETGRKVQVVAWPQPVANPSASPYGAGDLGAPLQQYLYSLPDTNAPEFVLRFPVRLGPAPESAWDTHRQAVLLLRILKVDATGDDGIHVTWSTPPQLVGFVAGEGEPGWEHSLGFMELVSGDTNPPKTNVINPSGRQVGVIFKPPRIRLPSSTITTPSPASATSAAPQ